MKTIWYGFGSMLCIVSFLCRLGTTLNRVSILVNHVNTFFSNLDDNYYKGVQCGHFSKLLFRFEAFTRITEPLSHFSNAGVD